MKSHRDWFQPSPRGTAKERFSRLGQLWSRAGDADTRRIGGRPGDEDLSEFFRNVAAGAHAHDLGDESLYLAEELAELQWSLGGQQKRALALLVLATMISVRQGSSRLPLERKPTSYLGQLVASLVSAGKLELDAQALLRDIDELTRTFTLDHIIGRGNEYRPLIVADGCVYQHRMLWCENRLADRLRARLVADAQIAPDREIDRDIGRALADVLARPAVAAQPGGAAITLSAEQEDAVRRAISRRFTVISGGPGTGKTAIVVTMLRVLARLGEPLATTFLAAPTGKAANRMFTSIRRGLEAVAARSAEDEALLQTGVEPQTMHRLLGYLPESDRFRHHENNPLPATTVIVDEASMIDLVLMERLLRALPRSARVVMLGDADQLPSVDAGAVLRDLVMAGMADTPGRAFAVRLSRSFRMDPSNPAGRAILLAAREVNQGHVDALVGRPKGPGDGPDNGPGDGPPNNKIDDSNEPGRAPGAIIKRATAAELAYEGVEMIDTAGELGQVHAFVDHWYTGRIRGQADFTRLGTRTYRYHHGEWPAEDEADLARLFAIYEQSRLLTVTRRQTTGSEAINRRLHSRVLADSSVDYNPDFYPGEPVMMRRNDYERGLFNGDQGMVVRVSENNGPQHFRVVFPRGATFALFHLDALRTHIELSFAMTVHKSQGSEFDEIALILPAAEIPLLTREMLYTGMTRARRSVVLVGTDELLRVAITQQGQRFSGLAEKLMRPPEPGQAPAPVPDTTAS